VIHLFREHRRTRFNLKTKACTVETLDQHFHRIEIHREAHFHGEAIIGTNAFENSGLITTHWDHENKTEQWAWYGVFTDREVGCIPVADDFNDARFGHVSSQYFDTVLGISDPNVFIPEEACKREAGVYGPVETVPVQEQTAGSVADLLKGEYHYDVDYPQAQAGWALFKQCDPAWANSQLGTCSQTICQAGCAMSSVAMILRTRGVNTNPGVFNNWLRSDGGYASGCELVWGAADKFGKTSFQGIENPSFATTCSGINAGHGIVGNVRGGTHWVLLTGCDGGSTFYVNDPGFDQSTYPFDQVLRMAVYH
jgi:hypothetical protein